MAIKRHYLPSGDIRRFHGEKNRSASKGASPKEKEQQRLAKKLRKLKNKQLRNAEVKTYEEVFLLTNANIC